MSVRVRSGLDRRARARTSSPTTSARCARAGLAALPARREDGHVRADRAGRALLAAVAGARRRARERRRAAASRRRDRPRRPVRRATGTSGSPRRARLLSWLSLVWMTHRGRRRDRRRARRRLGRADRLRARLGHRGIRLRDHRLALHRRAHATPRRPRPRAEARRAPVLPPRAVRRVRICRALVNGERPDVTLVGIALAFCSVV